MKRLLICFLSLLICMGGLFVGGCSTDGGGLPDTPNGSGGSLNEDPNGNEGNGGESGTPDAPVEEERPLVYFSFDEVDENGNYYDLVSGNASKTYGNPITVAGKNGSAVKIRDDDSYLSFATELPVKNQAHTIMAWVKLDMSRINSSSENVIAGWGNYSPYLDTRLLIYHNEICVTSHGVFTTYPIPHDANKEWYHLTLVYDGNNYSLYVNGIFVRTVSAPQALSIQKSPIFIGGFSGNSHNFSGEIDDLYVFDRVLDRSEIVKYKNNEVKFTMAQPNNHIPSDSTVESFDAQTSVLNGGWNEFIYANEQDEVPFKIFIPDDYDKTKKYPVILFLHGDGSNGGSVDTVLLGTESTVVQRALIEGEDCIAIVPVARSPWLTVPNDKNVVYPYKSYSMNDATPSGQLLAVEELLVSCIENLAIDSNRVYLAGYSRGTMGCWYLLQKNPERYAAATVCCGAGDPSVAEKFAEVPLWVFMGNADPLVSFTDVQAVYTAYLSAGGVGNFTVCQGGGHDVAKWLFEEKNLIEWLFSCNKETN